VNLVIFAERPVAELLSANDCGKQRVPNVDF